MTILQLGLKHLSNTRDAKIITCPGIEQVENYQSVSRGST